MLKQQPATSRVQSPKPIQCVTCVILDHEHFLLLDVSWLLLRVLAMNTPSSEVTGLDQLPHHRLIRRKQVQQSTGLSASSIYQLMADNSFPQSVQLSERRVAWVEQEIIDWIEQRIRQRQQGGA